MKDGNFVTTGGIMGPSKFSTGPWPKGIQQGVLKEGIKFL